MAKKTEKNDLTADERKVYICKASFKLGSNKNGTAKNSYVVDDKITLNAKQAEILTKENKI